MVKKLTQGEIDSLTKLQKSYAELTTVVGNVEMQILALELRKDQFKNSLLNLQEGEIKLGKELEDKYGDGSISLEAGEFTPNK